MRDFALLGTLLALAALAACKGSPADRSSPTTGSNAPRNAGSAVIAPPPKVIDAAAPAAVVPFALPAGARTVPESEAKKADATALGSNLTLQVANKLGEENDGYRQVDESLVLVGSGSLIVEIAFDMDDAAAHAGSATGALYSEPPLSPSRPFRSEDATVAKNMLPFKGPLLFLRQGKGGELAVAHVDDTIVAWRLMVLHGEGEEGTVQDWFEHAKITLAPGATVTAK